MKTRMKPGSPLKDHRKDGLFGCLDGGVSTTISDHFCEDGYEDVNDLVLFDLRNGVLDQAWYPTGLNVLRAMADSLFPEPEWPDELYDLLVM
jgi:hypothetical protein